MSAPAAPTREDLRAPLSVTPFASRERACEAAADAIAARLRQGLARRGWASFAASGAAPASGVYPRLGAGLRDWSRIAVTLTDDVFAPPTHPASRAAAFGRAFVGAQTSAARFFPLWSPAATADTAAFGASDAIAPLAPFDAVLLALEDDGGVLALAEAKAAGPRAGRVVARPGGAAGHRLTLNLQTAGAERVVLLAFGAAQLETLARAEQDRPALAAALRGLHAELFWAA